MTTFNHEEAKARMADYSDVELFYIQQDLKEVLAVDAPNPKFGEYQDTLHYINETIKRRSDIEMQKCRDNAKMLGGDVVKLDLKSRTVLCVIHNPLRFQYVTWSFNVNDDKANFETGHYYTNLDAAVSDYKIRSRS